MIVVKKDINVMSDFVKYDCVTTKTIPKTPVFPVALHGYENGFHTGRVTIYFKCGVSLKKKIRTREPLGLEPNKSPVFFRL